MWTLEQVRAEYHRLDRLLGIDTSGIPVRFSKRMTRQYGVCTFLKNRPQEIRLADFLRQEDAVFWDTARHEYAHAAAALLTGNLCDRLVSLLRRRVYQGSDFSNESFALVIALLMPVTVDIYVLIAAVIAGCLLYTSPSPRD